MALPRQVEKQLREVEELEKRMQAQGEEPASDTAEAEPKESAEPKAEAEQPVVKETPKEQAAPEPKDDFQQKYNTLRGKYDAEVPRLHAQVKELTVQVQGLQQQLQAKEEAVEQAEQKVASLVTDADREAFGEDLLDVQRRVAMEVASKYESRLEQQAKVIAELKQEIGQTRGQVGEMSFEQRLNSQIDGFSKLNHDPKWVEWLNEYDPIIRGPRRIAAQAAYDREDVDAITDYVKMFRDSTAPKAEEPKPRQTELEKQVTPTRSAQNSVQSTDSGKRVYSSKEMSRLWDKVRNLNMKQRYDEANKLEADITAAYVEGRVRP